MPKITPAKAGAGGLAGGLALATALIAPFEGLRTHAYLDAVGVPTICYGSTAGVRLGQTKTKGECLNLLSKEVLATTTRAQVYLKVPVTPKTAAAMISFAYNVGLVPFSKVADDFNHGRQIAGCERMRLYVYGHVHGKAVKLPGLVSRRGTEADLCETGLSS